MTKIGIVGYYGHGNFGDDLFLHVFQRLFPADAYRLDLLGHSGSLMRRYRDSRLDTLKGNYRAIVVGGGDILIPGYDVSEQYLLDEFLQVPVFVHGVGVPTWTGYDEKAFLRMKKFIQSDAIQGICARDRQSADWINTKLQPKVHATFSDDMVFSLADTLEDVAQRSGKINCVGIVMRGGQNKPNCKMHAFVHQLLDKGFKVRFLMLATGKELDYDFAAVEKLDCLQSSQVDAVVRQSDSDLLHAFGGVDVVYSMKFHGCIAALMHGIPTVALITTDKFVNLYKKLGLEKFIVHHTNEKLLESVEYFTGFPHLDIGALHQSSSDALKKLKADVESAITQ